MPCSHADALLWTSICPCRSATFGSSIVQRAPTPVLWASAFGLPQRLTVSALTSNQRCSLVTSCAVKIPSPPFSRTCEAVASPLSTSMSVVATLVREHPGLRASKAHQLTLDSGCREGDGADHALLAHNHSPKRNCRIILGLDLPDPEPRQVYDSLLPWRRQYLRQSGPQKSFSAR